jgi:hypothetical protein
MEKAALKNRVFLAQFIMIYVTQLIYIINAYAASIRCIWGSLTMAKQILLTTVLLVELYYDKALR